MGYYSDIVIGVSDSQISVSLNAFSITVNNVNDVPVIETISDQVISEDVSLVVTLNITDDGLILTENYTFLSSNDSVVADTGIFCVFIKFSSNYNN